MLRPTGTRTSMVTKLTMGEVAGLLNGLERNPYLADEAGALSQRLAQLRGDVEALVQREDARHRLVASLQN